MFRLTLAALSAALLLAFAASSRADQRAVSPGCFSHACAKRVCDSRACKARTAPRPVARARLRTAPAGGILAAIRACESGGDYALNTGNGFYGAYQFTLQTWRAYGGRTTPPSAAPPSEQDAVAGRLLAAVGVHTRSGWPNCPR